MPVGAPGPCPSTYPLALVLMKPPELTATDVVALISSQYCLPSAVVEFARCVIVPPDATDSVSRKILPALPWT